MSAARDAEIVTAKLGLIGMVVESWRAGSMTDDLREMFSAALDLLDQQTPPGFTVSAQG